jgi:hypothetical protein
VLTAPGGRGSIGFDQSTTLEWSRDYQGRSDLTSRQRVKSASV